MEDNKIRVGDKIYIPAFSNKMAEGVIWDIDKNVLDKRMEYKVCFDEYNIITFFDEETILAWKNKTE